MSCRITALAIAFAAIGAACSDERRAAGPVDAGKTEAPVAERYATSEEPAARGDADDTGRNVRDRDGRTLTPGDQSNDPADIDLTQRIRQGITSNDSMSLQARNVKVIARNGVVTLRGPVETEAEKESIEAVAKRAGATRIDSQLEIDRDDAPGATE